MEIIEEPDGQSCLIRLTRDEWMELREERGYLMPELLKYIQLASRQLIIVRYLF